jgi:hypothetical protein
LSCTRVITLNNVSIVDNPGLGDTEGIDKDSVNLQRSIAFAKEIGYLNVEIIIFESQNIRFDTT